MPTLIRTGEAHIMISYRLQFEDGTRFAVAVVPLDQETATQVLGNVTVDYSLVIPLIPQGVAWPFLRNFRPTVDYVSEHTNLTGSPADLLTRLMPDLVKLANADVIIDVADQWYRDLRQTA